jgi:TPR repeat protein
MLPYYLAFTTYQMGENRAKAAEYYKIASMNDDAPTASRILGILALSAEGDYLASALNFALIGSTGYDIDPYSCRAIASNLIEDLIAKRKPDTVWINQLSQTDKSLKDTREMSNPISNSSDNCYDMTTRSIKSIYLAYIAGVAE